MTWSGGLSYMCFLQEAQIRLLFEEHRGTQACARLVAAEMGPAWKASSITQHLRKLGLSRRAQSAERAAVFSVRVSRHAKAKFCPVQALISTGTQQTFTHSPRIKSWLIQEHKCFEE